MKPTVLMGMAASVLSIFTYVLYNKDILKGRCKPNMVTWGLGSFLLILNAITYIAMCNDWVKGILSISTCITCCVTFVLSIFRGSQNLISILLDSEFWQL